MNILNQNTYLSADGKSVQACYIKCVKLDFWHIKCMARPLI